ncbi:flippase [Pelagibacterium limicola]|uniref:flippase n=1 Tax=Pelagibacterium limicola TaxID=2791022 RepID=UPI0018AFF5F4|nr:flippase [Pelagibacterium limicola]
MALTSFLTAFRSGQGLKGQLLRGGVGSVAIKIGSTLLNVGLAIVLARALGAEGFGVYSFVFALITIMAIPAQMGLPNLVVRETAKAQAGENWGLMKGLWRWSSLMALGMSAVLMAIGALAAWIFAANLPEGGIAVFYWGLVLVPLVALGNLRGAALRGLRHVVQGQLPEFILRPAFLIGLVLAAHFGLSARALTASDAMMLHAVASLMAFMIGAWLLLRARPVELKAAQNPEVHTRLWLASAVPLAMIAGMNQLITNTDVVMLGFFKAHADVGYYKIAVQGAVLVALVLSAANLVVMPHIARLYAQGDLKRLQRVATTSARSTAMFSLPAFLVIVVFGREIIGILFGNEFEPGYTALVILACGQLINALASSVGPLLSMSGHERHLSQVLFAMVGLNMALNYALIPMFGITGAALATATTIATKNLILWGVVRRHLGIDASALGLSVGRPRISTPVRSNLEQQESNEK